MILLVVSFLLVLNVNSFSITPSFVRQRHHYQQDTATSALIQLDALSRVSPEDSQDPIPFMESDGSRFIECFMDATATVDGTEYTLGVPCDHAVALCYFDDDDELVPVELDEPLMDDVFPIAESIVAEEFGEELVLQRTPQTLTLVGELEDEEDLDDEEDDDDDDDDADEVEVLLSFEHRDKEFNLVRLLDPVLLVAKEVENDSGKRFLLTPEESIKVMPQLEEMFLAFQDELED